MKVLCIFVSMVAAIKADYHEEVGIPLAARIRAYEDKLFDEGPEMESRVAGSVIAPVDSHPYLAGLAIQLRDGRASMCAGALLTHSRVVTIAQCVHGALSIEVVLGSQYLYRGEGRRFVTTEFKAHPKFDPSVSLDYDIANVKLPVNVLFTELIQSICLPCTSGEAEYEGESALVSGWGLTGDSVYFLSTNAQVSQARLKVINDTECREKYQSSQQDKNNICTSGEGGVGPCRGDAGAPLVSQRHNVQKLVGLSSYGPKLCEQSHPAVFTRIHTYKDFIMHY